MHPIAIRDQPVFERGETPSYALAAHICSYIVHTQIMLCRSEELNRFPSFIINKRHNEVCSSMEMRCVIPNHVNHISGVVEGGDSNLSWPRCFPSECLGSTPGPEAVMRGQEDRQPGFTDGAGGIGQAREAKGYKGLRCILIRCQLQIPLPAIFVSPITANKIALWSKNPAEDGKSRGRLLHILIPPSKGSSSQH